MRTCTLCKKKQKESDFYKSNHNCKTCKNKMVRSWRKENPEKYFLYDRKIKLKNKYGMTPEDYDRIFSAQKGKCAICLTDDYLKKNRHYNIDHDHKTGKVRGLLCNKCNQNIGIIEDNIKYNLERIIKYLKK